MDSDLWRRFRIKTLEKGTTATIILTKAVEDYAKASSVKRKAKKRPARRKSPVKRRKPAKHATIRLKRFRTYSRFVPHRQTQSAICESTSTHRLFTSSRKATSIVRAISTSETI